MKNSKMLILAGIALSSGWQAAHAQREAPSRGERRTQRQQANQNLTPDQQRQNLEARFQERLQSATPEQRQQMMQMRTQIEERMRNGSLTGADMATIQQFMGAGGANGAAAGGRGGRQGRGGRGGAVAVPQTPEQRDAQRRLLMISAGIFETNVQDDIIAFLNAEEKAREPLLALARAAATSLNASILRVAALSEKTEENEQKVNEAFTTYTEALAKDKVRHEAALKSLDASIGYMSNPRLKAFLTLAGVIDNDALALGGAAAIFPGTGNRTLPTAGPNLPRQARTGNEATTTATAGEVAPLANVGGFGALAPAATTG